MVGALSTELLTVGYGSVLALRGVSALFPVGSITAVVGENGAGKSTLLACLGGLLRPRRGAVLLGSTAATAVELRACVGWLGHEAFAYRELTVRANLELIAGLHGCVPSAVDAVLDRLELRGLADRRLGQLSRGQRQRAALARALVHEPAVLLLDEPWTGLDAAAAELLAAAVRTERGRGATVVLVTHGVGRELADRELRLSRGRLVS